MIRVPVADDGIDVAAGVRLAAAPAPPLSRRRISIRWACR